MSEWVEFKIISTDTFFMCVLSWSTSQEVQENRYHVKYIF